MNGYLPYSRVKEDTRLNDAKMAEVAVLVKELKKHFRIRQFSCIQDFAGMGSRY